MTDEIKQAKKVLQESKNFLNECNEYSPKYVERLFSCYREAGVSAICHKDNSRLLLFCTNAQLGFLQKIWRATKKDAKARTAAILRIHQINCWLYDSEKRMEAV